MAVKNSPNLLSPDDERDPRTLGDDTTSTPGGTTNVDELLFGRSEERLGEFKAIADTARETLGVLGEQFRKVDAMEFEGYNELVDASALDAGPPRPGLKMRRLRRALNMEHVQRGRFEVAKTQFMLKIVNQMNMTAAQLRQADPAADAYITGMAEAATKRTAEMARIASADARADAVVNFLAEDPRIGREGAEALRGQIRTELAGVLGPEEVLKKRLVRDQALANLAPSIPENQIASYDEREQGIIRKSQESDAADRARLGRTGGGKTQEQRIADYMQPANLFKTFNNILKPTMALLQSETVVPGRGFPDTRGRAQPGLGEIPATPELSTHGDLLAAESFYDKNLAFLGNRERVVRTFELYYGKTEGARMIEAVEARLDMSPKARTEEREKIIGKILNDLSIQFGGASSDPADRNSRGQ